MPSPSTYIDKLQQWNMSQRMSDVCHVICGCMDAESYSDAQQVFQHMEAHILKSLGGKEWLFHAYCL